MRTPIGNNIARHDHALVVPPSGGRLPHHTTGTNKDTHANGSLDQRVYFTSDANYNVTGVISTAGAVLQHQVYLSYGVVTFTNASWTAGSDGYGLEHAYQGMLRNAAIGWYYSGQSSVARWYGPDLMIWLKPDQGYIDSMGLYQFVSGSPINYTDGCDWIDPCEDP